jgi:hypothetical protein
MSDTQDIVQRLRAGHTDWDRSQMVDGEPPMPCITAGDVREAADTIERLERELAAAQEDARRLDAMQSNPRWHLDCEVLKFGAAGKWRVWKLLGNQFHSTNVKTLGEGETIRAALDAAIQEGT